MNHGELIIYQTDDGLTKITVNLENDTVWLNQEQMALLFDVERSVITKHIKNIFHSGELDEKATSAKIAHVQKEGDRTVKRKITCYTLDVIIAVGYRVNSKRATQFRIWATKVLKEYMIKGFAMDDERLKGSGGGNYWKELLARIRDIRSSEKVLYRQVLDLYATSVDYDPKSEKSVLFFKIVQNKLHYAAHGQTAAEVVYNRADADKQFMGLTNFTGREPVLSDVTIAKNYLTEKELLTLNNLVSSYFDLAEDKAIEETPMTMQDYINELDRLIAFRKKHVLDGKGKISHKQATEKAIKEYRTYQKNTLSPVEKAYIENLKKTQKKLRKK